MKINIFHLVNFVMYSFTLHAEWKSCLFEKRMLKNTIYGHEIKLTPGENYIIKRL